jgi:hypothetical protein
MMIDLGTIYRIGILVCFDDCTFLLSSCRASAQEKRIGLTLLDSYYYIMRILMQCAVRILNPMVLPTLGRGGNVIISFPTHQPSNSSFILN